jgi:hypothetical protein
MNKEEETIELGVEKMTLGFEEIFIPSLQHILEEINQIK